jgi:hypothetical protein
VEVPETRIQRELRNCFLRLGLLILFLFIYLFVCLFVCFCVWGGGVGDGTVPKNNLFQDLSCCAGPDMPHAPDCLLGLWRHDEALSMRN